MSEEKTDKEFYDMASHFKEEHERLSNKIKSLKNENKEIKKGIMIGYSFLRSIDNIFSEELLELPDDLIKISNLCEVARGQISEIMEEYIFYESKEN